MSATTRDKLTFVQLTQDEAQQLTSWLRCYPVEGMDYTCNRLLKMLEGKMEASRDEHKG